MGTHALDKWKTVWCFLLGMISWGPLANTKHLVSNLACCPLYLHPSCIMNISHFFTILLFLPLYMGTYWLTLIKPIISSLVCHHFSPFWHYKYFQLLHSPLPYFSLWSRQPSIDNWLLNYRCSNFSWR